MARRDAEEFTAFVLSSQSVLRRTAFLMCGDWALASDHVQEALIRVYRHWPRLRGDAEARSYARKGGGECGDPREAAAVEHRDARARGPRQRWCRRRGAVGGPGPADPVPGAGTGTATGPPGAKDVQVMRYDFVTGGLSTLGAAGKRGPSDPQGAGDYVLWYDGDGGHVARVPQ
jgi:hypothetical protein